MVIFVSSQTNSNNFEEIYLEERISPEGIFCCITRPFIFPFDLLRRLWKN